MKHRNLASVILGVLLFTLSLSSLAQAKEFSDIKSPVLKEAVDYLNDKGIIKGYDDGTFKPEQVINRAEALKIIFESRGIAVDEDSDSGFPDVDTKQWFAKYVTSAKRKGLIKGYADGTYKPTQEVNKVEFIKIAMLAQDYYQVESDYSEIKNQFSDLDEFAWYMPYVAFGHKMKFIDRIKKLHPTHGITRGEAALIIYRIVKHIETRDEIGFDPKNPPDEAFTDLNPYVREPIDPSLISLINENERTLIKSYQSGYQFLAPKGAEVVTWKVQPDTVVINKDDECIVKIRHEGTLNGKDLLSTLKENDSEHYGSRWLILPTYSVVVEIPHENISRVAPGFHPDGVTHVFFMAFGDRYVSLSANGDQFGNCLDIEEIKTIKTLE